MTTKKTKTTQAEHPWTAFMDLVDHVRQFDTMARVEISVVPCAISVSAWWTLPSKCVRMNVRKDHSNALHAIAEARAEFDKIMAAQLEDVERSRDRARTEMEFWERSLALLSAAKETP